MDNQQIKDGFNQVIRNVKDADTIARLEICREYFSNPQFKVNLQNFLWGMSNEIR